MSPSGALIGGLFGLGTVLIALGLRALRRPPLESRVLPWLRDLPAFAAPDTLTTRAGRRTGLIAALLQRAAVGVEQAVGGAASVRRRLDRAGLDRTVHDFRVEQVLWGLVGFAVAAVWGLLRAGAGAGAGSAVASLVVCLTAVTVGVLARDNRLSAQVKARERRMLVEFPTIAELLALAVAAGESPVVALERVVARSRGELDRELARVLADIRTGTPVAQAFDALAARTGLAVVARFASGIAVAIERGTPLADVLHAQAADVREAGRRDLIEVAARKEVLMMVPVVFLVLPTTVVFAFYPGLIGLQLIAS